MNDYNLTLFEVCEILNKSKKTISRYIRQGRLKSKEIKSKRGTLEYRFSREDLDNLKDNKTGQDRTDKADDIKLEKVDKQEEKRQDQTRPDRAEQDNILSILKDNVSLLKNQLEVKDNQLEKKDNTIKSLIERQRETNILIKGLQDKIYLLNSGSENLTKPDIIDQDDDETDKTGQEEQTRQDKIDIKYKKKEQEESNSKDNETRPDQTGQDKKEKTEKNNFNKFIDWLFEEIER